MWCGLCCVMRWATWAARAYAVLSFGVWAQLPRSINTAVWTFFALAIWSTRNRFVTRFRRLREPRYLVGSIVGAVFICTSSRNRRDVVESV